MAHCSWSVATGILALFLVAKIVRRIVWHRRIAGPWGGLALAGCGGDRARGGEFGTGFRGRGLGRSRWLRAVFHRLDTTPGQEREIRAALEDLVDRARDARSGAGSARVTVARAIAGEAFDESAFEATSARLDATRAQLEDAMRSALRRVHGVLDAHQRARLAAMLEHGFWGGLRRGPRPPGAGPYRSPGSPSSSVEGEGSAENGSDPKGS